MLFLYYTNCDAQCQGDNMTKIRETRITLHMSEAQKAELAERARQAGLSMPNYLRSLLGWPLEQQGTRKDLAIKYRQPSNTATPN
jgi:hypothetical protein